AGIVVLPVRHAARGLRRARLGHGRRRGAGRLARWPDERLRRGGGGSAAPGQFAVTVDAPVGAAANSRWFWISASMPAALNNPHIVTWFAVRTGMPNRASSRGISSNVSRLVQLMK